MKMNYMFVTAVMCLCLNNSLFLRRIEELTQNHTGPAYSLGVVEQSISLFFHDLHKSTRVVKFVASPPIKNVGFGLFDYSFLTFMVLEIGMYFSFYS